MMVTIIVQLIRMMGRLTMLKLIRTMMLFMMVVMTTRTMMILMLMQIKKMLMMTKKMLMVMMLLLHLELTSSSPSLVQITSGRGFPMKWTSNLAVSHSPT